MWTSRFWRDAGERALKTFAQSAASLLAMEQTGLLAVDWVGVASGAGLAALLSLLSSVASTRVGSADSPSLVK